MPTIPVVLADDHAVLRAGLKLLLSAQSDMEVVGEAADGPGAVRSAQATAPHVVLLDFSMPGPGAAHTIGELVRLEPRPRVLVLTMHDDPAYMQAALVAGASGYLVKKAADVELLTAIRAVHPGEARPAGENPRPLSRREVEVLRLVAQGHTNQEVADQLAVSVKTIETHRKRLSDKLGLRGRAELFRFAVETGLLEGGAALPVDE